MVLNERLIACARASEPSVTSSSGNTLPESDLDSETVSALLRSRADVNAVEDPSSSYCAWTALHWAARRGSLAIVQTLLSHNADVMIRSAAGWTALHLASEQGHADVTRALLLSPATVSQVIPMPVTPILTGPMSNICANNAIDTIDVVQSSSELLLLTATDNIGRSAAHVAAAYGRDEVLSILLEIASNYTIAMQLWSNMLRSCDMAGYTVMDYALKGNHIACMERLGVAMIRHYWHRSDGNTEDCGINEMPIAVLYLPKVVCELSWLSRISYLRLLEGIDDSESWRAHSESQTDSLADFLLSETVCRDICRYLYEDGFS